MRLLFVTHRGHIPERTGGGQQSIHSLLRLLTTRGHTCEAVVSLRNGPRLHVLRAIRRLSGRECCTWADYRNGYHTFRAPDPFVVRFACSRLSSARPDIVVADFTHTNPVADAALQEGIPVLLRVISLGCVNRRVPIPRHPMLLPYANSAFVAERLAEAYGIDAPIIYPIVSLDEYRTIRRAPEFITFINPIPTKGVRLAMEIARRLPARRFLFVEGVPLDRQARASMVSDVAATGNVTLLRPQQDVRRVYARTSLLMVPSEWEESFGRVVLEAQVNGIPVIARAIGGLPEAVGQGGILMPRHASPAEWADVIDAVLSNPERVRSLSAAALANTARPQFEPHHIVDGFLRLVEQLRMQAQEAR